jgi:hypothetical protein
MTSNGETKVRVKQVNRPWINGDVLIQKLLFLSPVATHGHVYYLH